MTRSGEPIANGGGRHRSGSHRTSASGTDATGPVRAGARSSSRPTRGGTVALGVLALLAAVAVGAAGGILATSGTGPPSTSAAATTTAGAGTSGGLPAAAAAVSAAGMPSRPTMMGRVVGVETGDVATVEVGRSVVPVRILGMDAPDVVRPGRPGECGGAEAVRFATERLVGQTVTLVPDPTLPETDGQGRRLSYVVMRSQLSFTDAALMAGMARADTSWPLWYADVFAREEADAVAGDEGIWGRPCEAAPQG